MSLYPARRASLLAYDERRSPDTDNDGDFLHILHPRYTCGLTDNDCDNGYCCSAAHECVLPSSSSGETLCRLPGFSTANAVASLASDATGSVTTGTAAATDTAVVISNGGISGSAGSTSGTNSSGSSLSAGAIAGIVVGVVVALAAVVGAVVFLLCVRRKRGNRRARNIAAATAPGVTETGYGGGPLSSSSLSQGPPVYQRVPGGGGDGGPVDMYAGSNVGKMQGGVPGRVEVMGDTVQRPVVQELPGNGRMRPVELDAGVEKK